MIKIFNPSNPSNTLVTAFVSNVNNRYNDGVNKYYNNGKLLLKSTIPKIIFVDKIMFDLIGNNYDQTNTVIIEIKKNSIYFYNYLDQLFKFNLNTNNTNKDTLEYIFTICNKTEWIKEAIEINPFNTDNFVWVDFGIKHVVNCHDDIFIEKINNLQFKTYKNIRIGGIWNINLHCNFNIMKDIIWYFAGGVFGGDKTKLLLFADLMKSKCLEIINHHNTILWEVNIWYLIYMENKLIFDIYNCDHNSSIIDNY